MGVIAEMVRKRVEVINSFPEEKRNQVCFLFNSLETIAYLRIQFPVFLMIEGNVWMVLFFTTLFFLPEVPYIVPYIMGSLIGLVGALTVWLTFSVFGRKATERLKTKLASQDLRNILDRIREIYPAVAEDIQRFSL